MVCSKHLLTSTSAQNKGSMALVVKTLSLAHFSSISELRGVCSSDPHFSELKGSGKLCQKCQGPVNNPPGLSSALSDSALPRAVSPSSAWMEKWNSFSQESVWRLAVCVSLTLAKQKWILKNARSLPDGFTRHLIVPFQHRIYGHHASMWPFCSQSSHEMHKITNHFFM